MPAVGEAFIDGDGDLVFLGEDGNVYFYQEGVDPEFDYAQAAREDMRLIEHRLGRPLSNAEKETVIEDMSKNGHGDVGNAFLSRYPANRTSDEDERQNLMAEYMEDAAAEDESSTS